ncbi:unnamed protein product [Lota lota]
MQEKRNTPIPYQITPLLFCFNLPADNRLGDQMARNAPTSLMSAASHSASGPRTSFLTCSYRPPWVQSRTMQSAPRFLTEAPPPYLRYTAPPVFQQPIAAHRMVSSVGQQAAVDSVAVGLLYAWLIGP